MEPKNKSRLMLGLILATVSGLPLPLHADEPAPAKPEATESRMAWWKDARFGMFIHWGLYAVPAGRWDKGKINTSYSGGLGEWLMHDAKIPVADYAKLAEQFNPTRFDADAWVSIARSAGMKYIVITAKHHDGFAMFRTKASPFNIVDATPFKRDPVAELATACRKQGIRFGVYYSQAQDWHHPGGYEAGGSWDAAQKGDYDKYLRDIAAVQVKELMSNYGQIDVIWWDTPFDMTAARAKPLGELLNLQPQIISNDRLGSNIRADYATPEQRIPANGYGGRPWETCMTINNTWGYKADDKNFKSTGALVHNLIDIASKGGNYLLNVGPTAAGIIPQPEVDRLKEMGAWLKINGEAVYGTTASPFKKQLAFGRATMNGNKMYLSVFDWPENRKLWLPLSTRINKAYLLADKANPLFTTNLDGGQQIILSGDAPDPIASVIVLELDGPPATFIPAIHPAGDGALELPADQATIDGQTAQLEIKGSKANIGYWTNQQDSIHWNCDGVPAGKYKVEMKYACDPASAGSTIELSVGDAKFSAEVVGTGGWDRFKTVTIGQVSLPKGDKIIVKVKPVRKKGEAVMNLRSVRLLPQNH